MPRPNDSPDVAASKTLSYILRHGAEKEGLFMRSDGYIKLDDVLARPKMRNVDKETVLRLVEENAKKRFELFWGYDPSPPRPRKGKGQNQGGSSQNKKGKTKAVPVQGEEKGDQAAVKERPPRDDAKARAKEARRARVQARVETDETNTDTNESRDRLQATNASEDADQGHEASAPVSSLAPTTSTSQVSPKPKPKPTEPTQASHDPSPSESLSDIPRVSSTTIQAPPAEPIYAELPLVPLPMPSDSSTETVHVASNDLSASLSGITIADTPSAGPIDPGSGSSTSSTVPLNDPCPATLTLPNTTPAPLPRGEYFIRASQGHSLPLPSLTHLQPLSLSLADRQKAGLLVHGTQWSLFPTLLATGLSRMNRQHIHLAPELTVSETNLIAPRNGSTLLIYLDLDKLVDAGIEVFVSANGVVLTPGNQEGVVGKEFWKKAERVQAGKRIVVWDGEKVLDSAPEE